jgi:hypothetical protein
MSDNLKKGALTTRDACEALFDLKKLVDGAAEKKLVEVPRKRSKVWRMTGSSSPRG